MVLGRHCYSCCVPTPRSVEDLAAAASSVVHFRSGQVDVAYEVAFVEASVQASEDHLALAPVERRALASLAVLAVEEVD